MVKLHMAQVIELLNPVPRVADRVALRSRISKKKRQCHGQMKKMKKMVHRKLT
jgi:ferritin-like metal-binding protein YciE